MIPDINLLPSRDRRNNRSSSIFIILIIIWVLLLALLLFQYFQAKSDYSLLNSKVESLTLEKTALETQISNSQSTHPALSLGEAVGYVEKLTAPTSKIIEELLVLLPQHSYISSYSFTDGEVSIQTQFERLDSVASYVTNLESSNLISDVKVNTISTFTLDQEQVIEDQFDEVPRYDVSFSIVVNMPSLLVETGGEENE